MLSYFRYELRTRRGSMIGWGLGVGFYVLMYSLFYPSLPTEFMDMDFSENQLYQSLGNFEMGTFEAYIASTVLMFMVIIIAIYAVSDSTGTLVGEEENGTLELMVTLPLHRWQIVVSKAAALAVSGLVILIAASLGGVIATIAVNAQIETSLPTFGMVLPILSAWPIVFIIMMICLFFSALMPQRRFAAGAGALIVAGSYLGNNLLPMVESMQGVTKLLPFHYYQRSAAVFTEGIPIGDSVILTVASIVFLLLAIMAVTQRNLTTGLWLWQRGKVS